jgi:hypothetical protein
MTQRQDDQKSKRGESREQPPERKHKVRIGNHEMGLPRSRLLRMALGFALILGGLLGFLPIVGFWMLPLGVLVLSYDLPFARRWRRRFVIWWHRRRGGGNREGDA